MTPVTRTANNLIPRIVAKRTERYCEQQPRCGYKRSKEVQYRLKSDKNLTFCGS